MNLLLLALTLLFPIQTAGPAVEGNVVDAATNAPLSGVQVSVTAVAPRDALRRTSGAPSPSVTTDGSGNFRFPNLQPGRYRVWAVLNGYARREVGSALSGDSGQQTGTVFDLSPGQSIGSVSLKLVRSGSVSGRVVSSTGTPLVGMEMLLLRPRYNEDGRRFLETEASTPTDDHGEYRLSGIGPGRYYVVAREAIRMMPAEAMVAFGQSFPEPSPGKYPTTYFPGTNDLSRASLIEVTPGRDVSGTNLVLARSNGYHMRGRILEEATGRPPIGVGFTLWPRPAFAPVVSGAVHGPGYKREDGTFDITFPGLREEGFASGSYWLIVTRTGVSTDTALPGFPGRAAVRVPVTIDNSDIDNLQVLIRKPVAIEGKVVVEGRDKLASDSMGIVVALLPRTEIPWASPEIGAARSQPTALAPDGTFKYENLLPDTYDVFVSGLPRGAYIKEARFGQADVLANPLSVSGPSSDKLTVVVSPNGAHAEGTLRDDKGQLLPHREIILVADGPQKRPDLYKTTTTNAQGTFGFDGIAPGKYNLYAWEAAEPFAYFDPDFISSYEASGREIVATESSQHRVDLVLIKAKD